MARYASPPLHSLRNARPTYDNQTRYIGSIVACVIVNYTQPFRNFKIKTHILLTILYYFVLFFKFRIEAPLLLSTSQKVCTFLQKTHY